MIGDGIGTDLAAAQAVGARSVLMLTGVTTRDQVDALPPRPARPRWRPTPVSWRPRSRGWLAPDPGRLIPGVAPAGIVAAMTIEVRTVRADELLSYIDTLTTAFLERPAVDRIADEVRPQWDLTRCLDRRRRRAPLWDVPLLGDGDDPARWRSAAGRCGRRGHRAADASSTRDPARDDRGRPPRLPGSWRGLRAAPQRRVPDLRAVRVWPRDS